MATGRLGKSDAERNREESHANTKVNLQVAIDALKVAIDWEQSWPNNITNLGSDLEQIRNRLRIIIRSVEPVDTDGHVRVVPATARVNPGDLDTGELPRVIVIGDD